MFKPRRFSTLLPWSQIWQRLPALWLFATLLVSVLGPFYTPTVFAALYLLLSCVFTAYTFRVTWGVYAVYRGCRAHSEIDWYKKYLEALASSDPETPFAEHVYHLIIIPNYKEEMETLAETLGVLASHPIAREHYKICLAMEETEAGCVTKAEILKSQFSASFQDIRHTVHPKGIVGESRGKSSNVSWAAREMSQYLQGENNIVVTVMDADTCFAQDYFTFIMQRFAAASRDTQPCMMFAPCIVFDRNSNEIPAVVRTGDNIWAMSVMSNMYSGSSVTIPCSAYSLSLDLVRHVEFWDVGPEGIGEDMHMYLKCFFLTEGRVHVEPVYSPASQCNVQDSSTLATIRARYTQASRHMWGALDTGYTLNHACHALFEPQHALRSLKGDHFLHSGEIQVPLPKLFHLVHRVVEAHVLLYHTMLITFITSLTIPNGPSSIGAVIMPLLTSQESLHPYVELAVFVGGYMRFFCAIPFLCQLFYYERYHRWVGFERWKQDGLLPVSRLGRRTQLSAERSLWYALDWLTLPVVGALFAVLPTMRAQICHLWTNNLDYVVAGKPTVAPLKPEEIPMISASAPIVSISGARAESTDGSDDDYDDDNDDDDKASTRTMVDSAFSEISDEPSSP
ncbi:glycosyl transferase family group 2-domain-containing protein [Polychytrium aggregatum]|uniref:glycosyl transferase family group 2-domain-containing protein n=1 Tax=Polychytrium aggregatum TaxID=110093 RepID=UPI0022FE3D83|nr:glycosyl transferase family group 2-domain-containing protein [Polychytrium aggregatum]KAI9206376.1 glycosyl transferase family group 2-domain-containing protein [Polychytrium aggregatum]